MLNSKQITEVVAKTTKEKKFQKPLIFQIHLITKESIVPSFIPSSLMHDLLGAAKKLAIVIILIQMQLQPYTQKKKWS